MLDLSGNSISSLKDLEGLPFLLDINLEENEVHWVVIKGTMLCWKASGFDVYVHVLYGDQFELCMCNSGYIYMFTKIRIYAYSHWLWFQIVDIEEVQHLKGLKLLRALNLSNNPIQVCTCEQQTLWYWQVIVTSAMGHSLRGRTKSHAQSMKLNWNFLPPQDVFYAMSGTLKYQKWIHDKLLL